MYNKHPQKAPECTPTTGHGGEPGEGGFMPPEPPTVTVLWATTCLHGQLQYCLNSFSIVVLKS